MDDHQRATPGRIIASLIKKLERSVDNLLKWIPAAISGRTELSHPVSIGTGTVVHASLSHCGAVYNAFGIVLEENESQVIIFPLAQLGTGINNSTKGTDMPILPSVLPKVSDPVFYPDVHMNPGFSAPWLKSPIYASKMQDRSGLILVPIRYVSVAHPTLVSSTFLHDIREFQIWDGHPKEFDHCR